jgi:Tetratricopeptide repeat
VRRLLPLGLLLAGSLATSSPLLAAHSGGGGHFRSSAPAYRAPVTRSAPAYHPMPMQIYAPRHSVQPGYSTQPRGAQVIHVGPTVTHPTVHHNPIYANPVRRSPDRFARVHGGLIGLPPLTALAAPLIVDIPQLGEIIVPIEVYESVYPLLTSENEVDRERAYTILKEQAEQNPESRVVITLRQSDSPPTPAAYTRGLAALEKDDFDAAIADFTAAIADDPRDYFSYIRRGTAYERKGDAQSAIGDYRKVLTLLDAESGSTYAAKIRKLEKTKK